MISYKRDINGIGIITLDMAGHPVNMMDEETAKLWTPVLDFLEKSIEEDVLMGLIITSGKSSFSAGGDLDYLHQLGEASEVYEHSYSLQKLYRRIERLKVPVVAALNGSALGGGYELALAANYRIALDTPKTLIGLPEVKFGMMPMGGAITRLFWMLGLDATFEIVSKGRSIHVQEALAQGMIDEIVTDSDMMIRRAKDYILKNPEAYTKLWVKENGTHRLPFDSDPTRLDTGKKLLVLNAAIQSRTRGNYPAVQAIFNAMVEGSYVGFDAATKIESRYFTNLVLSNTCQNMTKAYWYDFNKIKNGHTRPRGYGRFRARKIGIVGAGHMGSGIAYAVAIEGIEVVLRDMSVPIAEQGKDFSRQTLSRLVRSGKMSPDQRQEILDRIHTTASFTDFEDCDLVIEAVFENEDLKKRIAREVEMHLHRDAFMGTNTSTLSIDKLSADFIHPKNYIGLHFFNPVTRVPVVEVIKGAKTSNETIARALDFVRQINRIPIVVKDSLGFFATRIRRAYFLEGIGMLAEGQLPVAISQAALQGGMATPPMQLADTFEFANILDLEEKMMKLLGTQYNKTVGVQVLEEMYMDFKRSGKGRGKGFYEYTEGRPIAFWNALEEHYPIAKKQLSQKTMIERMLFVQCLEAVRCLDEGIINTSAEANLGSIHGAGFADFKGGVIQYMNDYGIKAFVKRAKELKKAYGMQFDVPKLLLELAQQDANFN